MSNLTGSLHLYAVARELPYCYLRTEATMCPERASLRQWFETVEG